MEYCENCGAKLEENSKFCPKCGHDLTGKAEDGRFADKTRFAIVILAIIIMALALFIAVPIISDISAGSQLVNVGTYDFKIPSYFVYDEKASNEDMGEGIVHKEWRNGDEHIEIAVAKLDPDGDVDKVLVSLGGYKEEKYDIKGHHYHFSDGEECFAYDAGKNDMISIIVSDAKLFDKIEIL